MYQYGITLGPTIKKIVVQNACFVSNLNFISDSLQNNNKYVHILVDMSVRYMLFAHGGAVGMFPIDRGCASVSAKANKSSYSPGKANDGSVHRSAMISVGSAINTSSAISPMTGGQYSNRDPNDGPIDPGSSYVRIAMSPSGNMIRIRDDGDVSAGASSRTHVTSFVPQRYYEYVRLLLAFRNRHAVQPYLCERFHGASPSSGVSECRWLRGAPGACQSTGAAVYITSMYRDAAVTVCSSGARVIFNTSATYNTDHVPINQELQSRSCGARLVMAWPIERTPADVLGLLCACVTEDIVDDNGNSARTSAHVEGNGSSTQSSSRYQGHVETLLPVSSNSEGTCVKASDVALAFFASVESELALLHDPLYFPSCAPIAFEHVAGTTYCISGVASAPSGPYQAMMRGSCVGRHIQRRRGNISGYLLNGEHGNDVSGGSQYSTSHRGSSNASVDTCPVRAECWVTDATLISTTTTAERRSLSSSNNNISEVSLEEALGNAVISISGSVLQFAPSYLTSTTSSTDATATAISRSVEEDNASVWAPVHVSMVEAIATAARNAGLIAEEEEEYSGMSTSALILNATFCSCSICHPSDDELSIDGSSNSHYDIDGSMLTRYVGCMRWALRHIRSILKLVAYQNSLLEHMSTQAGMSVLSRPVESVGICKRKSPSQSPDLDQPYTIPISPRQKEEIAARHWKATHSGGSGHTARIIETKRTEECVLTAYDNGAVHALFSDFSIMDIHPTGDVSSIASYVLIYSSYIVSFYY